MDTIEAMKKLVEKKTQGFYVAIKYPIKKVCHKDL